MAKYQKLADLIRKSIIEGEYNEGDRIETENELADKYHISRQTVRQAIKLLETDGLLTRVRGSGTYVESRKNKNTPTMTVGVITTYITEYIFPSILRGIEEVLSENKYIPSIGATGNRVETERKILLNIIEKPVDGLIIEGTKTSLPNPNISLYHKIRKMGIPFVFINGYYPELENSVYVKTNDFQAGLDIVRHLVQKGHREIAGIFKSDDMQGHQRYAGYVQGILEAELDFHDNQVFWFTTESRDLMFNNSANKILFDQLKKYSAVVCYNDELAIRLINAIRLNGLSIPGDIAIASFDNSHYSGLASVPITSVDHPKEELGRTAARKLLNMINGKPETSLTMPWEVIIKEST
ncbi:MAG: GntR family transcriptional regulator [Flexilinea sp.]